MLPNHLCKLCLVTGKGRRGGGKGERGECVHSWGVRPRNFIKGEGKGDMEMEWRGGGENTFGFCQLTPSLRNVT